MATSQNLEDMKLPELKELAKQMGLRGTSTMRKPELLATLQAARSGGEAPAGVTVRAPRAAKAEQDASAEPAAAEQPVATEPAVKPAAEPKEAEPQQNEPANKPERPARATRSGRVVRAAGEPMRKTRTRIRKNSDAQSDDAAQQPAATDAAPVINLPVAAKKDADSTVRRRRHEEEASALLLDDLGLEPTGERADRTDRRRKFDDDRAQNRRRRDFNADDDRPRRRRVEEPAVASDDNVRDLDDILATLPTTTATTERDDQSGDEPVDREFVRRSRNRADRGADRADRADRGMDRHQRRLRGRDRDFDNADHDQRADRNVERDTRRDEPQDDLVPVAGIVDVLESYAFVRTSGYLPGPNDVYVSMGQVKKYGLRKGDAVHGSIRAPRDNDRRNQRQKFVPLQSIDSINGMSVEDAANRPQFSKLTPLYPQERLKQETTPNKLTGRIMDIVAPIGKGQRGLIVSPPKAGKTITLQNIANAIATNNPEVHLMVVLVDERPEEVTDMERTVAGEVIASTFDRPASDHTTVAELAIERAKRLVELGQDVVVLLDSMTRLARAYNIAAPASGRILSGGVDAQALYPPKKFFGAARNIENGGSLTIISSALVETGSKMDEVIFEEFKGTGNMELRLSRELADKRLFPAIDINASGTRREELLTAPNELPIIYRLRRLLGGLEPEQAYQTLVPRLKKAPTNRDFLAAISQQANSSAVNGN
ncbi:MULTISPECIES: transcription termination factor Rho [Bifidobacterium]|uniref:transcription termination factor Rho n=1 Tax=Bifidobacterium TaxID=1678 RepID=UPI001BDCDA3E|nr:transcription termination factor Rho [Bifidobacterium sp. SO1]MBW3078950.1 transcription termination factor Rho [Bifidobacterium simiiventris]